MAKIYKKEELEYINGYLVKDDDVIAINPEIVDLLNQLDTDLQRKEFNDAKASIIDLSGIEDIKFERESEHAQLVPEIHIETPIADKKVEEAKAFMNELDLCNAADKAKAYFEKLKPATAFVIEDYVLGGSGLVLRFDLPTLGNPLELTRDKLATYVFQLFDVEPE